MNERIKQLRKSLDLTQQEFAVRIGTVRNNIAGYETGKRSPSEAVISLICRTFNVSDTWLRTGVGEMFSPDATFDLGEYAKQSGMTELETEILKAYFSLDPGIRDKLLQHFKEQLTKPTVPAITPARTQPDTAGQERTEPDIMAELAELKRQNQELAAKVAAMEEEDALLGLTDVFSASPSVSVGNIRPAEKAKK